MTLAPVALFCYKRPAHLAETLSALSRNHLAAETELIIYSDGPKGADDSGFVNEVRSLTTRIRGFKRVTPVFRDRNMGLSGNLIDGISDSIRVHGRVIVLEEDLITSPYFLQYMNEGLGLYEREPQVSSINAYCYPLRSSPLPATYFIRGADCWGWGTWKRGWEQFNANGMELLDQLVGKQQAHLFDLNGAFPYTQMLRDQIEGKNDSWAIRWQASVFLAGGLTLYPGRSLVRNAGFDGSGVHCAPSSEFDTELSLEPAQVTKIPIAENPIVLEMIEQYFRNISSKSVLKPSIRNLPGRVVSAVRRRFRQS